MCRGRNHEKEEARIAVKKLALIPLMLVDKRFRLGQLDEVLGEENRFRMLMRSRAHRICWWFGGGKQREVKRRWVPSLASVSVVAMAAFFCSVNCWRWWGVLGRWSVKSEICFRVQVRYWVGRWCISIPLWMSLDLERQELPVYKWYQLQELGESHGKVIDKIVGIWSRNQKTKLWDTSVSDQVQEGEHSKRLSKRSQEVLE